MSPFNQKLQPQAPVRVAIDRVDGNVTTFLADSTTPTQKAAVDASGNVAVKLVAGTALIGKVGIDQTTLGTTNNVYVTTVKPDGTNIMPSMDAAARRGYQQITDGTNTMPTMDVAARKGFVQLTDGTNSLVLQKGDLTTTPTWYLPISMLYGAGGTAYFLNADVTSADGRPASGSTNISVMTQSRNMKFNGSTFDRVRGPNIQNGGTAVTTVTLSAGGAGLKHRLHQILVSASAAGNVTITNYATFVLQLDVANKTYQFGFPDGILQSTANTAIDFTHSVAGTTLYVFLHYNTE